MRRLIIAGLVLIAAAAAGTAMAGGLLNGHAKTNSPRATAGHANVVAACHCKRGPRGPRGFQGPQGEQGPQGPQGAQGPAGAAPLFAVVNADGTIYKQSGVTGVEHNIVGQYVVTFNRNVDDCAAIAAPGGHKTAAPTPATPNGDRQFVHERKYGDRVDADRPGARALQPGREVIPPGGGLQLGGDVTAR